MGCWLNCQRDLTHGAAIDGLLFVFVLGPVPHKGQPLQGRHWTAKREEEDEEEDEDEEDEKKRNDRGGEDGGQ